MSLSNLALNQLIGGLAVATSQYQLGRSATDIFNGLHPFLPAQELENGLSAVVDPLRRLAADDGTLSPDLAPEALAGAFYEASRQLAQLTEESHPPISRLADDFRQVWRRGLSHPPAVEARAMALDFRDDDQVVESLRQLVEFSPEPMGVVKCHPDGSAEMILFNRKNRERWGLNGQQVAGVDVLRFFYAEDHDMVRDFIRECLESGSASRTGVRMRRQAGGHLLVDMYVGRIDATSYAYFQVIDETQREEAFEQVRIRDAVFQNASKPLLMLRFDDDGMPVGMVTSAGFHKMLGYAPGEIGTKPVMDFIPRHLRLVFAERLREFLETGSLTWQAVELMRKDGSTVLVDIEADDSGVKGKRFAIVSFSDAKIRLEAEGHAAAAQRLDSAKETAAHIAHNMNNGLTVVSGGLQLIGMKNPDDEFIASMIKSTDMMARMMNRFRKMTDTVEGAVDLHSLLDPAMIQLMVPKVKGVEIALDLEPSPWKVPGPSDVVFEFVNNIIKNALESMENTPDRRLLIATENVELLDEGALRRLDPENRFPDARSGNFLQLTIQDTGTGIPETVLARIFDDYFSTKSGAEVRRGRGLNATQKAIAMRGGLLTVRSTLGSGTTFDIYLPKAEDEESTETAESPQIEAPQATTAASMLDARWMSRGDEVVLIADDEADIREQYGKILGKYYGYKEVLFARTTAETLEIVRERPDLTAVVMDWRMKGDTGDILLSNLLALRPKLPILVNTAAVPEHNALYPSVQFSRKLKGMMEVPRAVRLLIDRKPINP